MIRYPITRTKLVKLVQAESKNWLAEASTKTAAFRKLKKYKEKEGSWSKIKKAYMTIQHGKCAYCERRFGEGDESKIEHDVEHFRPKSKVRAWPTPEIKAALNLKYSFTTGTASTTGYYLLAYNIFNYVVTCKKCNTIYKSDYFPIAGKARMFDQDDPRKLKAEKSFLIYPLGNLDDDPEDLITFQGIIPVPKYSSGRKHDRARLTIDFFKLAIGRDELLFERAMIVKSLYLTFDLLAKYKKDAKKRAAAQQTINMALSPSFPHANCARAFHAICMSDPKRAESYFDAAYDYLSTKGY